MIHAAHSTLKIESSKPKTEKPPRFTRRNFVFGDVCARCFSDAIRNYWPLQCTGIGEQTFNGFSVFFVVVCFLLLFFTHFKKLRNETHEIFLVSPAISGEKQQVDSLDISNTKIVHYSQAFRYARARSLWKETQLTQNYSIVFYLCRKYLPQVHLALFIISSNSFAV